MKNLLETTRRISRRDFIKLGSVVIGGFVAGAVAGDVMRDIEFGAPLENLQVYRDQYNGLWVGQLRMPVLFSANKPYRFDEAATYDDDTDSRQYGYGSPTELLGYVDRRDTQRIKGFALTPEPDHPGDFYFYVHVPRHVPVKDAPISG